MHNYSPSDYNSDNFMKLALLAFRAHRSYDVTDFFFDKKKVFKAPWRFFVLGGCIAIYFVLMFEGLKIASSVSLAAVFTFAPLLSGLFGYILVRQKMSLSIFTALIIGAIGALCVVF